MAIGVLALAGWAFDAPRLKSVLVGGISMKPNAAIGAPVTAMNAFFPMLLCHNAARRPVR